MNEVTTAATITNEQLELVRNTVAKEATAPELKLFLYDCQRQNVHPLDKLIHFTKRGGRYVPITSIDFLRRQAGSTGAYAGADDGVFAGEPAKAGFACRLAVYRIVQGVRCEWSATARWEEYYPGDAQGQMWRKMPHVMLSKVAEALALRKAFADVLHGLYTKEEMDQAGPAAVKDTRSLKEKLTARVEQGEEPCHLPTPNEEPTPLMDYAGIAPLNITQEQVANQDVRGIVHAIHEAYPDSPSNVTHAIQSIFPGAEVTFQSPAKMYDEPQYPLQPGPACTATMKDGVEIVLDGFPVGKHKNQPMDTIPVGYLHWASTNMSNQMAKNMAVRELERRAHSGA